MHAALVTGLGAVLRARLLRRGRVPGIRTAKTTLAAVLAFAAADALGTSPGPVLAPLTALLVVQLTMYETVTSGLGRIVSVTSGVCVAVGVASVVGLTWWSLGIVVLVSLVLGRLLQLGDSTLEVPISAMIVLAVGGNEELASGRVVETLIGAAVGVGVNAVVAPPLYVQPAEDALADLVERMATFLRELAVELRVAWEREEADRWLDRARGLGREVQRADKALARAEESSRFNPRGARARSARPRLRQGLTALEHAHVALRSLCRAMLDRAYFVPEDEPGVAYRPDVRAALADLLEEAATALDSVGDRLEHPTSDDSARALGDDLADLHLARDRLSTLLHVAPWVDPAAWAQHGALLAGVDRLRVELEAAVRPDSSPWRPVPVTERQRQALRRAVSTPRRRRPR